MSLTELIFVTCILGSAAQRGPIQLGSGIPDITSVLGDGVARFLNTSRGRGSQGPLGLTASNTSSAFNPMSYLQQFGFLQPRTIISSRSMRTVQDTMEEVTRIFQQIANVPITGKMDGRTLAAMVRPRCGNRDDKLIEKIKQENGFRVGRKKRFVLSSTKWEKNDLTYKFHSYCKHMARADVETTIQRAFDHWASVTPLSFRLVSTPQDADINIVFATDNHGDNFPFDGPGRVLAHAFIPPDGRLHFDDAETFTISSPNGTNLDYVAVHEIGHVLGLDHSDIPDSVMAPFIRPYNPHLELHSDDIAGVQEIYGKTGDNVVFTTTTSSLPSVSLTSGYSSTSAITTTKRKRRKRVDPCKVQIWQALVSTSDGNAFLFRSGRYFRLDPDPILSRTPLKIADDWNRLPNNIESAFTLENGLTVFTKDYWSDIFENKRRHDDKMYYAQDLFMETPAWKLDAAWSWNSTLFFSSGKQYWQVGDGCKATSIRKGWNTPTGLKRIHAAGVVRGKLYFIFRNNAYRVDETRRETVYEGKVGQVFFGCSTKDLRGSNQGELNDDEMDAFDEDELSLGSLVLEDEPSQVTRNSPPESVFLQTSHSNSESMREIRSKSSFNTKLSNARAVRRRSSNTNARGPM